MLDALQRLQSEDDRLGAARGRGVMIAVELVKSGTDEPDAEFARTVAASAHQAGVIVLACGTYGNVLRFLPRVPSPMSSSPRRSRSSPPSSRSPSHDHRHLHRQPVDRGSRWDVRCRRPRDGRGDPAGLERRHGGCEGGRRCGCGGVGVLAQCGAS
ncbi:aminotransferase class III-fold pyridoxal phosphate-dependent enzyme [Aeromicrobium wangtongii]|uniref:aminotransferase class III-fold pyridoxal phosphate-dependent enzyme n=1 Tax=Aeromicrobium wangtongii TaxID=2969247 RepID=UPI00384C8B75